MLAVHEVGGLEGQVENPHPILRQDPRPLAEDFDRHHKGREKVPLWGLCGNQEILIDSTAGAEMIRLTDKAGQVIVMNAAAVQERIQATDKSGSVILMDGVMGNIIVHSSN